MFNYYTILPRTPGQIQGCPCQGGPWRAGRPCPSRGRAGKGPVEEVVEAW